MNWILIAYLVCLVFVSFSGKGTTSVVPLRLAWSWFAAIPISHFVAAIFKAGNLRDSSDMILVEIWADGFAWLFLGVSIWWLGKALVAPPGSGSV